MHKLTSVILLTLLLSTSFSQIRRIPSKSQHQDSILTSLPVSKEVEQDQVTRKSLLKELNLTREQMIQLKSVREANQEKMEKINADSLLTEMQRKQKIRQFRNEQMQLIQSVLTDEQKQKYKQLISENMKKLKQQE